MEPVSRTTPMNLNRLERRSPEGSSAPSQPLPVMSRDGFTGSDRLGRAKTAGLLAGAGTATVLGLGVGMAVAKLTRSAGLGVGAAVVTAVGGGLFGTMAGLPTRYGQDKLTAGEVVRSGVKGGMAGFVATAWLGPKAWAVAVPAAAVTAATSHTATHLASHGNP